MLQAWLVVVFKWYIKFSLSWINKFYHGFRKFQIKPVLINKKKLIIYLGLSVLSFKTVKYGDSNDIYIREHLQINNTGPCSNHNQKPWVKVALRSLPFEYLSRNWTLQKEKNIWTDFYMNSILSIHVPLPSNHIYTTV